MHGIAAEQEGGAFLLCDIEQRCERLRICLAFDCWGGGSRKSVLFYDRERFTGCGSDGVDAKPIPMCLRS